MHGEIGTDIVATSRIEGLMRARGTAFLQRWFTTGEIDYCSSKAVPGRHFAARFAAKEAVVKVLRMPWEGPVPWRNVEIVNDRSGAPSVRLSGPISVAAAEAGVSEIKVSLSHCDAYAVAVALAVVAPDRVVAERRGPDEGDADES